jgi:osmotically-inducible protein OsmY
MIRPNEEIKKDIVDQLYWDNRVDASDIKIDVSDGKTTLYGTVPTNYAREAAAADAWSVPGVSLVDNQVSLSFEARLPERESLEDHLRRVLTWNPEIDETTVQVTADGGHATLEGTVDALWKKFRAEDLVLSVLGVVDVTDKITVVPTRNVVDEAIARDVVQAIERNAHVSPEQVDVQVENGTVILTGRVPSWHARNAAYDAALFTLGARDVEDKMVIGQVPPT